MPRIIGRYGHFMGNHPFYDVLWCFMGIFDGKSLRHNRIYYVSEHGGLTHKFAAESANFSASKPPKFWRPCGRPWMVEILPVRWVRTEFRENQTDITRNRTYSNGRKTHFFFIGNNLLGNKRRPCALALGKLRMADPATSLHPTMVSRPQKSACLLL